MQDLQESPEKGPSPVNRKAYLKWGGVLLVLLLIAALLTEAAMRSFVIFTLTFGVLVALGLYLWHKGHPLT